MVDHPLRPKVMWEPVAGATEYRIQLDDCGTDACRTCSFPSPELDVRVAGEAAPAGTALQHRPSEPLRVSTVAPVGRRYVWRVAACHASGCGDWSESRYLNVGRHEDDFNGDGYADLVVGAQLQDNPEPDEGNAFVYYGGPDGLGPNPAPDVVLDNPADQANGQFGISVAGAGDLDGDGYPDLVAGAYRQDSTGKAFVYYGGADGFGPDPAPGVVLDNPADQVGHFGISVASAREFDGDGHADVVVARGHNGQSRGRALRDRARATAHRSRRVHS